MFDFVRTRPVTTLAIIAAFCLVIAYSGAFKNQPQVVGGVLCFFVGQGISIWVHELGHAVAARLVGWRIIVFAARPIAVQFPNRDIGFMKRSYEPGVGGWVGSVPPNAKLDTSGRNAAFTAAGPTANIIFGLLILALADPIGASFAISNVRSDVICALVGYHSILLGLVNLVPSGIGEHSSDGRKLYEIAVGQRQTPSARAIALCAGLVQWKVRLRDIPDWLIERVATEAEHGAPDSSRIAATIVIARALDSASPEKARIRQMIETFRKRFGDSDWLAACDAYAAAVLEQDIAKAQAATATLSKTAAPLELASAARAASSALLGNRELTAIHLHAMESALKAKSPFVDHTYRDIRKNIEAIKAAS